MPKITNQQPNWSALALAAGYTQRQADYISRKFTEKGIVTFDDIGRLRGRLCGTEVGQLAAQLVAQKGATKKKKTTSGDAPQGEVNND